MKQTAGNGVVTTKKYNAANGRVTGIAAGASGAIANFAYTYDGLGQMTSRSDVNTGLNESFTYDSLNRLTSSTVGVATKWFSYDWIGNLTGKSDVGVYSYPAAGQPRPHAVSSIYGTVNSTFSYDNNGNQTAGAGLTYIYTSFNKPQSIARGANTVLFSHDADHQRFQQFSSAGTTTYLAASGAMAERLDGSGSTTQWTNYLMAGGELVGMRVESSTKAVYTRYFTKDDPVFLRRQLPAQLRRPILSGTPWSDGLWRRDTPTLKIRTVRLWWERGNITISGSGEVD